MKAPLSELERAVLSIGPYVGYPDGTVSDRRTGAVLWKPGDPIGDRPSNPDREQSNRPHHASRGL